MNTRLNRFLERNQFLHALARIVVFFRDKYRLMMWSVNRPSAIKRYLKSHQVQKLQLGAGPNILEGWLNTDIYPSAPGVVYLNAKRPFPFDDKTFGYVFSEHQIEHLPYIEGLSMLRECRRVLKPGGRIRIATPDLEILIGLYTPQKSDLQQRYINWIVDKFLPEIGIYSESFVINNAFLNWGHQFIYDRATLQIALEKAGFVNITPHKLGESDDKVFRGIESHGKVAGDEDMNQFETMVLEAKRPPGRFG